MSLLHGNKIVHAMMHVGDAHTLALYAARMDAPDNKKKESDNGVEDHDMRKKDNGVVDHNMKRDKSGGPIKNRVGQVSESDRTRQTGKA